MLMFNNLLFSGLGVILHSIIMLWCFNTVPLWKGSSTYKDVKIICIGSWWMDKVSVLSYQIQNFDCKFYIDDRSPQIIQKCYSLSTDVLKMIVNISIFLTGIIKRNDMKKVKFPIFQTSYMV